MKAPAEAHWSIERAAVSAVVTLLFLLQSISIGFATGATSHRVADPFGVVCATTSAKSDSAPVEQKQHVGPCCILHCSSAIEADDERAPVVVLRFERPVSIPAPDYRIDAAIAAPELRPLSPRAPPARLA